MQEEIWKKRRGKEKNILSLVVIYTYYQSFYVSPAYSTSMLPVFAERETP